MSIAGDGNVAAMAHQMEEMDSYLAILPGFDSA